MSNQQLRFKYFMLYLRAYVRKDKFAMRVYELAGDRLPRESD